MITRVSSINHSNPYFGQNQNNKKRKALNIAAGIVTAATAGALVSVAITKYKQIKSLRQMGSMLVERPKVFTQKMLDEVIDDLFDQELVYSTDKIMAFPMKAIKEGIASDKELGPIIKGMKMSKNGFAVAIVNKNQEFDVENIRYFDPECNTILGLVNAIRNNRAYECKF